MDISTVWVSSSASADWQLAGSVLASGNDLDTALIISIFSDRIAGPDDVIPDGTTNPRGWCLDDSVPLGSRLWLLQRAKQIPETARRARDYIVEAIQWMVDDGVVAKFDTNVQWIGVGRLGAQIIAYMRDGSTMTKKYAWAWNEVS
jgi:phage gp46-like protein